MGVRNWELGVSVFQVVVTRDFTHPRIRATITVGYGCRFAFPRHSTMGDALVDQGTEPRMSRMTQISRIGLVIIHGEFGWHESSGVCGIFTLLKVQLSPTHSGQCHGKPIREIRVIREICGFPRRLTGTSTDLKCTRNIKQPKATTVIVAPTPAYSPVFLSCLSSISWLKKVTYQSA